MGLWFCFNDGRSWAIANLGGTAPLVGETAEYTINIAGHAIGLFGTNGFFLSGGTYDVAVFGLFLFAMVFMDTAVTIPTGTLAERWKWASFVLFALFMSMFVYPIFGNWVWGGGWLAQLGTQFGLGNGHVDYAGSSVVHLVGGVAALAGGIVIGPRIGKYTDDGKVNVIPGHNLPFAILGVFILAFGWFGFNAGSSLAGGDLRITVVAVNTMLASATGAIAAMIISLIKYDKADINLMANGFLAGLVAITAPCAFVTSVGAAIIGAAAAGYGLLPEWTGLPLLATVPYQDRAVERSLYDAVTDYVRHGYRRAKTRCGNISPHPGDRHQAVTFGRMEGFYRPRRYYRAACGECGRILCRRCWRLDRA